MNLFLWFEAHRNPLVGIAERLGASQESGRAGVLEQTVVWFARATAAMLPGLIGFSDALGRAYVRVRGNRAMPTMASRKHELSVVIVSWNGRHLLTRCLSSVRAALARVPGNHEVILVDNGSADDTVSAVAAEFPDVKIIGLKKNRGFAIANNRGVRMATRDLVLLLNNDIVLPEGALRSLVGHFDDPEVFAAAPRLVSPNGELCEGHSWSAFRDGMLYFLNERQYPGGLVIHHAAPTLYAVGGCALMDRRAYWLLGGLDTMFSPFCWEDDDIGYRARKRGLMVIYDPRLSALHDNSATMNSATFSRSYVSVIREKNMLLFIWKTLTDTPFLQTYLESVPKRVAAICSRRRYLELFAYALAFLQIAAVMRRRIRESPWQKFSDEQIMTATMDARKDATGVVAQGALEGRS